MENNNYWFINHDTVCTLSRYILSKGWLPTPEQVICYFEKPWKWQRLYDEMVLEREEKERKAFPF